MGAKFSCQSQSLTLDLDLYQTIAVLQSKILLYSKKISASVFLETK